MICGIISGSIVSGLRQPILFSFLSDKPTVNKGFREPETIHYKKVNKSVLRTFTFYLEDDTNEENKSNGKTLNIPLQLIKI